jgi:hypothetical protein
VTYEFRNIIDFQFGTLTSAAATSDTVLQSAEFASLSTGYSTSNYFPIILLNPATKTHEKCWLVGHTAASTSGTFVRGRESTAAQAWPSGTQWVTGPTIRDVLTPGNTAALPTDPHLGMRGAFLDKLEVWENTYLQGWLGSVRATAADMGRAADGTTAHPNGRVPQMKMWTASGTTTAGGVLSTAIPNGGFPVRFVAATLTRYAPTTPVFFHIDSTSTNTTLNINCSILAGTPAVSVATSVCVLAVGY